MPQNNQNSTPQQMVQILPSDYLTHEDDSIDLLRLILNLKKRWRQIFLITFIGTALSIAIALYLPKIYQSAVEVSLPKASSIVKLEENGLTKYSKSSLFKEYYDKARSQTFLKQYITTQGYLQKLYPEEYSASNTEKLYSKFVQNFKVEITEPKATKGAFVEEPSRFSLSLQHNNEALLLEILNGYLNTTNESLLKTIKQDQIAQRKSLIGMQQSKIALLRSNAKASRALQIEKITANNQLAIRELYQKKELLIQKSKADRTSRIAKAQEARIVAKSLNIISPTRLEGLNDKVRNESKTNITLTDNQNLPLYLMGTKYLDTLIKTLQTRKNDEIFLNEINEINLNISKIKNDQQLRTLKERQSDDPFITSLPNILNTIETLKSKSFDFTGVKAFTLEKAALLTNKAIKPKRALIVVLGGILSVFIALIVTLLSLAIANRKEEK